ncbi:exported hypothetical protein [Candidatus Xenohaliotis californiensis]|uniref:Outer membrane protein beta-barrel domain-containing protein n=1 Tax=Candidatus Xenohaliotis californiensis TaxID=84677 RepID=A0ABP0ERM1_9RICK|nr:exported hypothetical protein [Candidatus Xenohaliotis californiensis]
MKKKIQQLAALFTTTLAISTNATAYSYMNIGGSFLYTFEENYKINFGTNVKTLMQSGDHGIGGYISLGSMADYGAGYELELGFTKIDDIKNPKQQELLSVHGPYAFVNYFALLSKNGALKPYLGIGAGITRLKMDDTNADSSIKNEDINGSTIMELVIGEKYSNVFVYQGVFGVNFITSSHSMVNIDYRYKTSAKPATFSKEPDANVEYAYRVHGLNMGIKIIF